MKGDSHWLALSFACGVFIGISPFYGAHTVGALVIVSIFRFNLMTTMMGAWLTFPPILPFVYYFSYRLGRFFLHDPVCVPRSRLLETINKIMHFNVAGLGLESRDVILIAKQLLLGCTIVGLVCSMSGYFVIRYAIDRYRSKTNIVAWFGEMICPYGKIREISTTADIGLWIEGGSIPLLFSAAAWGMSNLITDLSSVSGNTPGFWTWELKTRKCS